MKRVSTTLFLVMTTFGGNTLHAQGSEWEILKDETTSLYRQGRYDRAEVVAKMALIIAEQELVPNHPDLATSLNNLAMMFYTIGRYSQAEPLYRRSLAIREKALKPDHPSVADSLENMAGLYIKTGRVDAAKDLLKRAEAIRAVTR